MVFGDFVGLGLFAALVASITGIWRKSGHGWISTVAVAMVMGVPAAASLSVLAVVRVRGDGAFDPVAFERLEWLHILLPYLTGASLLAIAAALIALWVKPWPVRQARPDISHRFR